MTAGALLLALAVVLAATPLTASARSPQRAPRVGVLFSTSPPAASHIVGAFSAALRDLGHVEGKDVVLAYRWAEGRVERFPELAADLVRLGVDVIVASSSPAVDAARRSTATIPIVMVGAADPVASGFVASLARPGGNVTGLSSQLTPEIRAKQLQLLREAAPKLTRVGVLRNAALATPAGWKDYGTAAQAAGVQILSLEVRGPEDLERTIAVLARERGALFVPSDPMLYTHRRRIVELANEHRLPAMFSFREYTEVGGLMSYSARLTESFRRAAAYVDKILRGARPGDLPVEQPTHFELVINLRTASTIGLAIPQALLVRAEELIQ